MWYVAVADPDSPLKLVTGAVWGEGGGNVPVALGTGRLPVSQGGAPWQRLFLPGLLSSVVTPLSYISQSCNGLNRLEGH